MSDQNAQNLHFERLAWAMNATISTMAQSGRTIVTDVDAEACEAITRTLDALAGASTLAMTTADGAKVGARTATKIAAISAVSSALDVVLGESLLEAAMNDAADDDIEAVPMKDAA